MTELVFGDLADQDDERRNPWERTASGLYVPVPPRRRRQLRALDLFAGCGGFSLGVQWSGINVVAAAEHDPIACMTYLLNLGSVGGCALAFVAEDDRKRFYKRLRKSGETNSSGWIGRQNTDRTGGGCRAMIVGDVTQVTAETIRQPLREIGESTEIDIVIGGPPCQGISQGNAKRSVKDPRNNLVLEFWRLADEIGAECAVMENVPPLLTDKSYRPLRDEMVARANAAGFDVTANVLDAVGYGVPQFRRRALVVGLRGDAARRPFSFPIPAHWCFGSNANGESWEQRMAGQLGRTKPNPEPETGTETTPQQELPL